MKAVSIERIKIILFQSIRNRILEEIENDLSYSKISEKYKISIPYISYFVNNNDSRFSITNLLSIADNFKIYYQMEVEA